MPNLSRSTQPSPPGRSLLLGTAGHIDHGKTTLVRALTGVDTDRLPDEKRRQITIDLGFAPLRLPACELGIVDVPGHERFVKNMLAGATGIDLALLVVAADDSVKPQTVEHLEILQYLRLAHGVVAVTKCDLADPEWIDLVEEELAELTQGTFLEHAPRVRVSAGDADSINALRDTLASVAEGVLRDRPARHNAPFHLAIDRVFSAEGHGTVVTGSVSSGSARIGDTLELQPSQTQVRVRGLQNHQEAVEQLVAGQRGAINVVGVSHRDVRRGQALVAPERLRPSCRLTIRLQLSARSKRPLKHRSKVRCHLGADHVEATVRLLEKRSELTPGTTAWAQLELATAVAAVWGQPFVLRRFSPAETIGGGQVIEPWAEPLDRRDAQVGQILTNLVADDPLTRAAAVFQLAPTHRIAAGDLYALAGIADGEAIVSQLAADNVLIALPLPNEQARWIHRANLESLTQRVLSRLAKEHQRSPLRPIVESSRLRGDFARCDDELFATLLRHLQREERIRVEKRGIALPDWEARLSESEQAALQQAIQAFQAAGCQPPSVASLSQAMACTPEVARELLAVAVDRGQLVRFAHDLYLDVNALEAAKTSLQQHLAGGKTATVSEIRELLATTRKIAVPLCEYFDSIGLLKRQGDVRQLATAARPSASSASPAPPS
jgi:selenocysteine-specific elongation factor